MKKNLKLSLAAVVLYFSFCAFQCKKDEKPSKELCADVACTMDYRTVSVEVVDTSNSIVIDKTETLLDGKVILTQDSSNFYGNGYYTVIDDSNMKDLNFREDKTVVFRIYSNGVAIKDFSMTVSRDCCHVFQSSQDEIYVVFL